MTALKSPAPALATAASFAALLTAGCGLFQQAAPASSASVQKAPLAAVQVAKTVAPTPARRVGDFFVHRFSGSFAAEPLTLTEEVAGREDDAWVVDFALSQNEHVERLRVRFDSVTGEPRSAALLDGTTETPTKLAAYEALMAKTIYAADVNDGLVSRSAETCLVGADELDCETKTYRVWVGDDAAKLSVVHAARFADRDVSGEITTADGKVIYRAELIEARQGNPRSGIAAR